MGSVRPISDVWILARSKIKYYGAYPAGFLERARNVLTGGRIEESIWHIPGGMAHTYNGAGGMPLSGYGPNDFRIDLDPEVEPDILMDIRDMCNILPTKDRLMVSYGELWLYDAPSAIIIDLPYSEEESKNYEPGPELFPSLNETLKQSLRIVKPGGLVGVLDWKWPNGSKFGAKCILSAMVTTGEGSRARIFTVWKVRNER